MKRGMRQFWQPHYSKVIGFAVFSVGLALLPGSQTYAKTPSASTVVVTPDVLEVARYTMSPAIVLQFLDSAGAPTALTSDVVVSAESPSTNGQFFSAPEGEPNNNFTVAAGASEISLYYKDSAAGKYPVVFTISGSTIENKTVEHLITVKDANAVIDEFKTPHTTTEPITVRGTLQYIPAEARVMVTLKNSDGKEVQSAEVTERGENIELAKLSPPTGGTNGSYSVELNITRHSEAVVAARSTPIEIQVQPTPPVSPNPSPSDSPPPVTQEPTLPAIKSEPPIETIEPISKLSLSSSFSRPIIATSSSARNFISAAGQPSSSVVAARSSSDKDDDDTQSSDIRGVKDSEQSITLQSPSDDKAVVEASEEGWRIFGAPWYWWGGGTAALYGAWFSVRRLVGGSE